MKRAWLLGSLLYLLLGGLAGAAEPPRGILAVAPHPAPDLRLPDIDGNTHRLHALRGQWVFVHFWASWCGPCRREMPAIGRLQQDLAAAGLRFMLVNTAEDADTVWTFLGATAPSLESLLDRNGEVTEAWRPRGLPATYLVDPQGRVRFQALGGRPWDAAAYRDFLTQLLRRAN